MSAAAVAVTDSIRSGALATSARPDAIFEIIEAAPNVVAVGCDHRLDAVPGLLV
jgi:hypothetical protein